MDNSCFLSLNYNFVMSMERLNELIVGSDEKPPIKFGFIIIEVFPLDPSCSSVEFAGEDEC